MNQGVLIQGWHYSDLVGDSMICFASYPFLAKTSFLKWTRHVMHFSVAKTSSLCLGLKQTHFPDAGKQPKTFGNVATFFLPSFQIHIYDRKQPCDFWLLRPKECREQIWLVLPSDSHATANASGASPRVPGRLRLQCRITHVKTTNWSYLSLVVIAINPTVVFENGVSSPIYGYINGEAHEPDHETSPHEWI
jgi:hypothetical protein